MTSNQEPVGGPPSDTADRPQHRSYYADHSKLPDFLLGMFGVGGVQILLTIAMLSSSMFWWSDDGGRIVMFELAVLATSITCFAAMGRGYIASGHILAEIVAPVFLFLLVWGMCARSYPMGFH